jgi:hypothetical protein
VLVRPATIYLTNPGPGPELQSVASQCGKEPLSIGEVKRIPTVEVLPSNEYVKT